MVGIELVFVGSVLGGDDVIFKDLLNGEANGSDFKESWFSFMEAHLSLFGVRLHAYRFNLYMHYTYYCRARRIENKLFHVIL